MSNVTPKLKVWTAGDSNTALLAWLIGGLLTLAGSLTLAEIAARIPKTGGIYVYICYSMASQQPMDALASVLIALTGIPVFYFMNRKKG